jgi:phosphopantothenate-cysteine ligase
MMSKKILITAGPTNEYIDEVMKITNMSTGRLGIELSRELTSRGNEVTLICTRSVARSGLYERYRLADNTLLRTVQIETTEQMFKALEAEQGNDYDLVVHAAAVGDYKADFSFRMEDMAEEISKNIRQFLFPDGDSRIRGAWNSISMTQVILDTLTNPSCKVNDDTKISSYEPNLTVKLGLTPKLISHLKEWFPGAILVGFKLLENVTKEHIIEVATKLCNKNDMDYIIANDLHDLRQGKHISYLCNKDGYCNFDFHSPDDIANKIISFVE